jgi:peroxiredoxin
VPFFAESEAILAIPLLPANSNTYYLHYFVWGYRLDSLIWLGDKQHGNKANSSITRDHRVDDCGYSSTGPCTFDERTGAPNFQLKDLSGNSHKLSDYRGKVVVIDFFGWACDYCVSDAKNTLVPMWNTYYKNDPNVQFLSVEINGGTTAQDQAFAQAAGLSWPVLAGGSSVGSAYQVSETPTTYVINPAGNVALSMAYPTNVQTLKSTIDKLEGSAQGSKSVFVQGTDGALWHKWYTGTSWSGWAPLGGTLTSSPAATSPSAGVIDVFARGSDGAIWYKDWNGAAWSSWHSLGGQIPAGTGPAACS